MGRELSTAPSEAFSSARWASGPVLRALLVLWLLVCIPASIAGAPDTAALDAAQPPSAASLRARYVTLQDRLRDSAFGLALYVDSKLTANHLAGDLYGVVNENFATVGATLTDRAQWCGLLMLHLNVKDCQMATVGRADGLVVHLGGKNDVAADGTAHLDYRFRVAASMADYVQIMLEADKGPYGTTDHRIMLEATLLSANRTFVHLAYSHGFGPMARMALSAYLNTVGKDKVGFTVVDRGRNGEPVYVNGVRGVVERNCMRYFLAVIAYLRGNAAPPDERLEKRLEDWFALTERYPRQLHEVSWGQYAQAKYQEYRSGNRQTASAPSAETLHGGGPERGMPCCSEK